MLINLFEKMPYTANGLTLTQRLESLPIMQDPNIKNWQQKALLTLISAEKLYDAIIHQNIQQVTQLLKNKNIDLNGQTIDPQRKYFQGTPLAYAIDADDFAIAKLLLAAGADPNIIMSYLPVHSRHQNACKLLLSAGAEINTKNQYDGSTLLINACQFGYDQYFRCSVKELLAAGANPNIQNRQGRTALIYASIPASHLVGWQGPLDKIQHLLAHGANPNIQDQYGRTALFYGLGFRDGKIKKLLIEAGANPNIQDLEGNTAIMWILYQLAQYAGWPGPIGDIRYLLSHGANPDIINNAGLTARDIAVAKGFTEIVKLLDEASAARREKQAPGCSIS